MRVSWPSGRVHVVEHVEAGLLLTVYENADHSPANEAYVTAPYFTETK